MGIDSAFDAGILARSPVVDVGTALIDGAFHDVDSSVLAFEIASPATLRQAVQKGGSLLLVPIWEVEVVTPERYPGSCTGDLHSRRGQVRGQEARGNAEVIRIMVPLADLSGYGNKLRSFSRGRATLKTRFDRHAPRPTPDDRGPPPATATALRR